MLSDVELEARAFDLIRCQYVDDNGIERKEFTIVPQDYYHPDALEGAPMRPFYWPQDDRKLSKTAAKIRDIASYVPVKIYKMITKYNVDPIIGKEKIKNVWYGFII